MLNLNVTDLPLITRATLPNARGFCKLGDNLHFDNGGKIKNISGSEVILANSSRYLVPSLAATNAATYSQVGTTITVNNGTAHNLVNTLDGAYVYLRIGSGDALPGWYSNFTYVGDNTFTCTSTVSQTTSGTVNTNTALTLVTPEQVTLPGGYLGLMGKLKVSLLHINNNSASTKASRLVVAGSYVHFVQSTTALFGFLATGIVTCRNSLTKQYNSLGIAYNLNLAVDFEVLPALQLSAANDYILLESCIVEAI